MRMLQRDFDVETRYGGGFVQAINGVAGGREDGRPVDWFYYVNGVLAERGAAAHELEPGDRIWWDHHDWGADAGHPRGRRRVPRAVPVGHRRQAAAGAARLRRGRRRRLRRGRRPARARSASRPAGRAPAGFGGEGVLRVKVGRWAEVRDDSAVRRLEQGPRASGVFARAERGRRPDRAARRARRGRADARRRRRARRGHAHGRRGADLDRDRHRRGRRRRRRRAAAGERARRTTSRSRSRTGGRRRSRCSRPGDAVTYLRRASPLHATRAAVASAWCVVARRRGAVVRPPARARRAARR